MPIQGVHLLVTRFVISICFLADRGTRLFGSLGLVVVAVFALTAQDATAKAPPLATTVLNVDALAGP